MTARKSKTGTMTRKQSRDGIETNLQKRVASQRISADVEAFERSGGEVEVLGTTRVLKKIDGPLQD